MGGLIQLTSFVVTGMHIFKCDTSEYKVCGKGMNEIKYIADCFHFLIVLGTTINKL